MYDYIKGEVTETGKDYAVIEAYGIGYHINTTAQTLSRLKQGQSAKLNCELVVREDSQTLYGFYAPEEKQMFTRLTGVSGIGPKVALAILSAMTVSELATAIITKDENAFKKVSGVGKKTAARLIIDLAEKIDTQEAVGMENVAVSGAVNTETEAVSALVSLGYNKTEAISAVSSVKNLADTTEDLILLALKRMGG